MSEDWKREQIILRAKDASMLLKHPLLLEAFTEVRELYVQSIEGCDLRDDRLKDQYMMALKMLKAVKNQLQKHIETGKLQSYIEEQDNE